MLIDINDDATIIVIIIAIIILSVRPAVIIIIALHANELVKQAIVFALVHPCVCVCVCVSDRAETEKLLIRN